MSRASRHHRRRRHHRAVNRRPTPASCPGCFKHVPAWLKRWARIWIEAARKKGIAP